MAGNSTPKKTSIERRADAELYANVAPHPALGSPPDWHRDAADDGWPSLVERFEAQLTPFTEDELEAAKPPHPHAFQCEAVGLFPVGEVSVIAAPGREGKTYTTIAVACAFALGIKLGGLEPIADRSVVIYSAEDDRRQYARKILAKASRYGVADAAKVRERVLVPDLTLPGMEPFQTLVCVAERRPVAGIGVDPMIQALRERMRQPNAPGLLFFETASTLSEAEEDNLSFRLLVRTLRTVARALNVAVVLVHHTSQAAASNLPELAISTADIRGGTALVNNARQCFLLVNLGSDEDPFPDNDARTVLRRIACERATGRVSALLCLDSSKALDPAPLFFEWVTTLYGPALQLIALPAHLDGVRWRKLQQLVRAERAEQRQAAKSESRGAAVRQVVEIVRVLHVRGQQPTARAVSIEAKRSFTWARPYLEEAVESGALRLSMEPVPRTKGHQAVYRPAHSTGGV